METNKNLTHPKYRSDIDGLRAIAVLSVVIYHAFPNFLKGGFVGVDIFFVISGFLISTIIFENLNNNSFSFATFYSRRIRRIFPALITVLITAVIFGYYVLFSDEFKQLGRHVIGGATFSSNFTLLKESGYFDTASEFKPLLHLWSLGIEEQFYIIFPLVCYCLYRYNVRLLLFIIPLTIISYYLNIKGIKTDITKTFYYPHTRFWELLFGSLLAYFTINKCPFINNIGNFLDTIIFKNKESSNNKQRLLNLLSILGFVILVFGLIRINSALKFPGKWALVPVIGSVLIILSGKESIINKFILSNKILVWFGKISFPLYLWHWVLLAYARIIYGEIPPQSWRISLVIAAIILSYLTYKFIESPLRFGENNKKKVIILSLLMIITGLGGHLIYKEKVKPINTLAGIITGFNTKCNKPGEICKVGNDNSRNVILLFGDSHAEQLGLKLDEILGRNYKIDIIACGGCFLDNHFSYVFKTLKLPTEDNYCLNAIDEFDKYLKNFDYSSNNLVAVITTQRWHLYNGRNINFDSMINSIQNRINLFKYKAKNIIVVGSTGEVNFQCEKSKLRNLSKFLLKDKLCEQENHLDLKKFIDKTQSMEVPKNVYFVYPYKLLCDDKQDHCHFFNKQGQINYFDDNHLSYYGSIPIVDEIKKIIESN